VPTTSNLGARQVPAASGCPPARFFYVYRSHSPAGTGRVEMATENLAAAPENGRLTEALFVAEQTHLLSAWPPTPAPAGASWPCSVCPISTAGC
jgi:hypothetical protein